MIPAAFRKAAPSLSGAAEGAPRMQLWQKGGRDCANRRDRAACRRN